MAKYKVRAPFSVRVSDTEQLTSEDGIVELDDDTALAHAHKLEAADKKAAALLRRLETVPSEAPTEVDASQGGETTDDGDKPTDDGEPAKDEPASAA